jgi:hypothetical protein
MRGLLHETFEVSAAGPGSGHEGPAAHAPDPGHRHAGAVQGVENTRMGSGVGSTAGKSEIEWLHA